MGDSIVFVHIAVEYTVLEYTTGATNHTTSGYIVVASEQTVVVVVAVAQTLDTIVPVPPMVAIAVAVSPLVDGLLPLRNMHPSSSPRENHMVNIPCLHDQQIDKTCNKNL